MNSKNNITVTRSANKDKKYTVKVDNKTIHFGGKGYDDYTTLKSDPDRDKRKDRYLARHKKDPNTIDSAGFWARELLWSKPDIRDAAQAISRKINRKVTLKI
jgi:hypothetical protein